MGLVDAPGRQQVITHCIACHSSQLILQNRMTRERWDETITWMQETQNLWPIDAVSRSAILDYLEATQGIEGAGPGQDSPWASPRYTPNPLW